MTDPAQPLTLRLPHDFNDGRNAGGFYEVVLTLAYERNVHTGDKVILFDEDDNERLTALGRVRCLVAIVEMIEP